MKETSHEKNLKTVGIDIITWDHDMISEILVSAFLRDQSNLILRASLDTTKRRELQFTIDSENIERDNIRGQAIYNKKKRKFTHIQYSDKYNWAVWISISSKVSWFARDHYLLHKKKFPFGMSIKTGTQYLLNN